jgi:hypothetical protein
LEKFFPIRIFLDPESSFFFCLTRTIWRLIFLWINERKTCIEDRALLGAAKRLRWAGAEGGCRKAELINIVLF